MSDGLKQRININGQVEWYDPVTNKIVGTEGHKAVTRRTGETKPTQIHEHIPDKANPNDFPAKSYHWIQDTEDRLIWAPKGTNPDSLPRLVWPFSVVTCNQVLKKLIEGKTLLEICKEKGMPPRAVIYMWRRMYPDFDAEVKKAKEQAAEYIADEVREIAKNTKTKKDAVVNKVKINANQWLAEKQAPSLYGASTKNSGPPQVNIVIQTGVPQPEVDVSVKTSEHSEECHQTSSSTQDIAPESYKNISTESSNDSA